MNEADLREEIVAQWGGSTQGDDRRYIAVDMLVKASLIAWNALAHPPSEADESVLWNVASRVGCRSRNPRTVLRRLITHVGVTLGWEPTESVLRAAGMRVPKS